METSREEGNAPSLPVDYDELLWIDGDRVRRISLALQQLLLADKVSTTQLVAAGDRALFVCHATEDEWNAFVECEVNVYPARYLFWDPVTHEIRIVDYPSHAHGTMVSYLNLHIAILPAVQDVIAGCGAGYDDHRIRYESDLSFIPIASVVRPLGAYLLPPNIRWRDCKTLRGEVGVAQGWGMTPGHLDYKALEVWARRPGIAYVLCVHVDDRLRTGSYKLYEMDRANPIVPAFQETPTPIVAPATVINLNSRRMVGLPAHANLPEGFPDPEWSVDLFAVLKHARRALGDDGDDCDA